MKSWAWTVPAVLGLGLMIVSYDRQMRVDSGAPWSSGFLCIGKGEPAKPLDLGTRVSGRLRYLPADLFSDSLVKGLGAAPGGMKATLEARLHPKLIELPADTIAALAGALDEGRLPEAGKDEVLAGGRLKAGDPPSINGRTLKVVGVLPAGSGLLGDSYLLPRQAGSDGFFPPEDASVQPVQVIGLQDADVVDAKKVALVTEAFPTGSFIVLGPEVRTSPGGFATYLTGQALFLLGGTGLLIGLYRWLAGCVTWPVLAAPLGEMAKRSRLLWGVHIVYFGLFVVGALVIYQLPALNTVLMTAVQGQIRDQGHSVLGVAGKAYGSGNIPRTALVTFVINFFLGSLVMITLPSLVIPGSGVLLAAFRALLWGLLLGPTQAVLAYAMRAHTGTLLLEGEGYILATFFAFLVPIYLFGSRDPAAERKDARLADPDLYGDVTGPFPGAETGAPSSRWQRFVAAVAMNLKGNILVAVVLIVAACYEAFEVITMAGR